MLRTIYLSNPISNKYCRLLPVPRKIFISDLKYFIPNLISGQKFFLKFLYKARIFLSFVSFRLNFEQQLAKSRLFVARKTSPGESRSPDHPIPMCLL